MRRRNNKPRRRNAGIFSDAATAKGQKGEETSQQKPNIPMGDFGNADFSGRGDTPPPIDDTPPPIDEEEIDMEEDDTISAPSGAETDFGVNFDFVDFDEIPDDEPKRSSSKRDSSWSDTRDEYQKERKKRKSKKRTFCPQPFDRTLALSQLTFQWTNFGMRVPWKQQGRLANYFPYVNMVARTTPLPNIIEYLHALYKSNHFVLSEDDAIDLDALFGGNRDTIDLRAINMNEAMAISANIFSDTVILLYRDTKKKGKKKKHSGQGNTQVIFPGKSTTSYVSKGSDITRNYVWTPSVEFLSYDYENIVDPNKEYEELETVGGTGSSSMGSISEQRLVGESTVKGGGLSNTGEQRTGRMGFDVDLSLCNSILVSRDYLVNSWLTSNPAKTIDRQFYTVLGFAVKDWSEVVVDETAEYVMNLEYLDQFALGSESFQQESQYPDGSTAWSALGGDAPDPQTKANPRIPKSRRITMRENPFGFLPDSQHKPKRRKRKNRKIRR